MKARKPLILSAALSAVALSLSACMTVDQRGSQSADSAPPGGDDTAASAPAAGTTTGELPAASTFGAAVTSRTGCAGGSIDIGETDAVVELTEHCANVTVSAADAVVLAPHGIGALIITGAGNSVATSAVESVNMSGSDNTVAYAGPAPQTSGDGVDNTVSTTPLQG
ncbi:DUF3060 domain-containing protein [Brevibacterium sp. 50QC2O2]|uniref:DUF3060 domain-containing protein n=1 Tax=Brevibacterium sp. 50QC2O2 TaxID=2968459 RepID=UPI00211C8F4C|nr:DUF3060 domain-containing protein [Brevibacterium sp. 50QC2O2]MCQ9388390.1 DUF3060 domain-containing protein [Brevibacterium sp. 50QC2O2]